MSHARSTEDAAHPPQHLLFETAAGTCAVAYGPQGVLAVMLPSHSAASTERALMRTVRSRTGSPSTRDASPPPEMRALATQLEAHLRGDLHDFLDVVLDERDLTEFRRGVYAATRSIPAGTVKTYGEIARAAGSPSAARAVGRALATNPFPIVVPCHRVLGSEHDLHGFSAPGGVKTKASLLKLEGVDLTTPKAPNRASRKPASEQPSLPFDTASTTPRNR